MGCAPALYRVCSVFVWGTLCVCLGLSAGLFGVCCAVAAQLWGDAYPQFWVCLGRCECLYGVGSRIAAREKGDVYAEGFFVYRGY